MMFTRKGFAWGGMLTLLVVLAACHEAPAPDARTDSRHAAGAARGRAGAPVDEGGNQHGRRGQQAAHEQQGDHHEGIVELSTDAMRTAGIRVAPVERRAIPLTLRTTARVDFDERRLAHVSPRINGRVHRVDRDLGDDVAAGEILAVLDSIELGEAKSAHLQARAEEELARETLAREERLFADRISSEQAVIEARARHKNALAALQATAERLRLLGLADGEIAAIHYGDPESALLPVSAPIDGRIVDKHLVVGELVRPGDRIFTIADLTRVWIWIDVFERDLARVHLDDDVAVVTEAWPGRAFHGTVSYIRDEVDADTRTARARIDVDNPDLALKPGMFAEVLLTDPHVAANRDGERLPLAVPASAVQRDGDEWIVFVEVGPGRYQRRAIERGNATESWVEVLDGVAEGERVVVDGAFIVKSEAAREQLGGHGH